MVEHFTVINQIFYKLVYQGADDEFDTKFSKWFIKIVQNVI